MRERQRQIVEHIQKVGIASYYDLSDLFKVSPHTIRRDIDYLAHSRLLAKIKGGAQRIETPSQFREARLPNRLEINLDQKEKIASRAIEFINPGDTIFLDGSSTITCLAREIARVCRDITIVTNSILVALELSETPAIRLIGIGGIFDRETFSFVGFDSDTPEDTFHVEKAFFSCAGFLPDQGTFENAPFNRATKHLIAKRADKVFLLIDSSKLGKRAMAAVLDIKEIDTVIIDRLDDNSLPDRLAAHNVNLITTEPHTNI